MAIAAVVALTGAASVSAASYTHTFTLRPGMTNSQVKDAQMCLMALGYDLPVYGADMNYGGETIAAVKAFQAAHGLSLVDGIIGSQTGAILASECNGASTSSESNLPEGCTSTAGYSTITGLPCSSTSNLPEGCQAGYAYSPITGEECNASSSDDEMMGDSGEEATLKSYNLKGGDDDTIYEGEDGEIARIEFDVEDADIVVERADLTFDWTGAAAGEDKPWKAFKRITLKADGKEIASEKVNDRDDWKEDTDPYVFRFTGMKYLVKKGDTAKISVIVEADDSVDGASTATNNTWDLYVDVDGIRATDEAGISQYIGDNTDKESFNIEDASAGEAISLKASSQDPDAGLIQVYDDKVSDETKVFAFKLESDEHDIDIDNVKLTFTTSDIYDDVVNDIWLEADGKKFDDYTVTNGGTATATLDFDLDQDLTIKADDYENVKVMVEFREQSAATYPTNTTVRVATVSVDGEGVDDVTDTATISGETHKLVLAVPQVTLESKTSSIDDAGTVATFSFMVKVAADDDDISFDTASDVVTSVLGPNTGLGNVTVSKLSGDATAAGTVYTILAGDNATFAVDVVVDAGAAGDLGVYRVELTSFAGETLEEIAGPETITTA